MTLGLWGNSIALRLERHLVEAAKLREGMTMTLRLLDDGSILVKPAGSRDRQRAAVAGNSDTAADPTPAVAKW